MEYKRGAERCLYIKAEFDDVAILDDVVFAFDAEFAGFAGFGKGAEGDEILVGDGFCGDESAFEIAVDDAGGLWGFVAGVDSPSASFFFSGGEVGAEAEEGIDGADEGVAAGFCDAEGGEVVALFLFGEVDEVAFDLG